MARFIGPDAFYNFFHGCILWQLVVVPNLFVSRDSSPRFEHTVRTIHVFKHAGIGPHSLLLHITNEAMREFRINQVTEPEHIEKYALQRKNKASLKEPGLFDVQEDEQMESFVICFF